MTNKENNVEQAKMDVRKAEAGLREARSALDTGTRKAKAEFEQLIEKLRMDVVRAEIELSKQRSWLANAETTLREPYKANED